MKYNLFLKLLGFSDKLHFLTGLMTERAKIPHKKYHLLKNYRNLLTNIHMLGFEFSLTEDEILIRQNDLELHLRKNSSDIDVFNQVLVRDEYFPLIDCIYTNNIIVETIIDAGCNIGLTTYRLLNIFKSAQVFCLEPDSENFKQLQKNLSIYSSQVVLLPLALWDKEEKLYINSNFRDGREWGRNVTNYQASPEFEIKGITLGMIIQTYNIKKIDILKIDIEGSEGTIFQDSNDLTFLDITKIIAMEIHDEFNCRDRIYQILMERNFTIFNSSELTIAINGNLR